MQDDRFGYAHLLAFKINVTAFIFVNLVKFVRESQNTFANFVPFICEFCSAVKRLIAFMS